MSQAEHQILPRQAIAKHSRIYWNVSWHILVTTYLTMLIANFTTQGISAYLLFNEQSLGKLASYGQKTPGWKKRERERASLGLLVALQMTGPCSMD